jgi:syntaxin 5
VPRGLASFGSLDASGTAGSWLSTAIGVGEEAVANWTWSGAAGTLLGSGSPQETGQDETRRGGAENWDNDNGSSASDYRNFSHHQTLSPDEMPCRDRTNEFKTTAKSYVMKIQRNGFTKAKPSQALVQDSMEFNRYAKKIGKDLGYTCAKLEKLALLARRKSIFDDKMMEIEELTSIVKQDIGSLNKQIAMLQEFINSRHSGGDGSGGSHAQTHSKSIVVTLQSKLAAMSSEFKQVLEVRTENLKHQKSRRDQFSQPSSVPSSLPPSASTGHLGSVLLSDERAANGHIIGGGDVAISMDGALGSAAGHQEQMSLFTDSYVQSRADTMQNIESTIVELGSIFSQLAHMVQEQGEMVQRIDSNVEHTSLNIEAAHTELLKYFRGISQNRWLMIKVFGILLVFFVVFVVFMT